MTIFAFDTIDPRQVLSLAPMDLIAFPVGSAVAVSVLYNPPIDGAATIAVNFGGHSATFDFSLVNVSANHGLHFSDGSELLVGGPGDDRFLVGIRGGAVFGGAGNDSVTCLADFDGRNLVQGNQGNDTIFAGNGADTIFGGQGDDFIATEDNEFRGPDRGDFAQGNLGNDTIIGGFASDILLGGQGNDSIDGLSGDDVLNGNLGNDFIVAGGPARMFGEDGNDTLTAFGRDAVLSGGAGADLFSFKLFAFSPPPPIEGYEATITDWASEDSMSVAGLRAGFAYQETTAGDFSSALSAANAMIHAGTDVVVVQIGADMVAFFQTGGGPDADLAVRLTGRALADIAAENFI